MRRLVLAIVGLLGIGVRADDPNAGLLAAYDFEDAEAGLLTDRSGHGHDGWVQGARPDAVGIAGAAFAFDGNDYVLLGDLGKIPAGTIAFWMKASAVENWRIPFSTAYAGWDDCMKFESNANGVFVVGVGPYVGEPGLYMTNMAAGVWYHVAFAWDATSFRGWLNGSPVFSRSQNGRLNTHLKKVAIGNGYSTAPNRYWKGLIDEVRVYERALDGGEVAALATPEGAALAARALAQQFASSPRRPAGVPVGVHQTTKTNIAASVAVVARGDTPASAGPAGILRIGFSNEAQGEQDVTEFLQKETLFIRVSDVDLPGRLDDTKLQATLQQTTASGKEIAQEVPLQRDGDDFTGEQTLAAFEPGEVVVTIKGLNRRGTFLFRASTIRVYDKFPGP